MGFIIFKTEDVGFFFLIVFVDSLYYCVELKCLVVEIKIRHLIQPLMF